MHIIAGRFKGRPIEMPEGIRPTSNKVRQSIFEILKGRVETSTFLDLYSGSGAVGIEAFSRGARSVTFVESNINCLRILKKNLLKLGILNVTRVHIYDKPVLQTIRLLKKRGVFFDIIFLDPPYHEGIAKNTLIAISNYDILARNGVIIVELFKKEDLPEDSGRLKKFRAIRYGDTKLEFFKKCLKVAL